MTDEQLDTLRAKLGGDWYDTWWLAISERFDPLPEFAYKWEPTFLDRKSKGWLEMYPPKKKTIEEKVNDLIVGLLND